MATVNFNYGGNLTIIQCDENEKLEKIIQRFLIKIDYTKNTDLLYLYNGNMINKELKFKEQANELDNERKKINILVTKIEEESDDIKKIVSKDIICPTCKDNILIDIKNYRINLSECKNKHKEENILLNKFEETQKIKLNDIKCNICEINNKGNVFNNEFFICNTCNKNICPLCKSKHDKEHIIINYNDKNYICKKHNESFTKYCKTCKEDICIICGNEHNNHDSFDLSKIFVKKNDLIKLKEDLKDIIDKFKYKINVIKEILDKMNNIMDMYYKINNNIINNYNINKRNYYVLLNINKIKNNNEQLIKELKNIIEEDKIYEYSLNNFYNDNGERYIGQLLNGLKEGKGIYYYRVGDIYEGDFKNNNREGKGIIHLKNRDKYEGDFKNDAKEGKGIYYYNNGNKYEGDWKDDKLEGKGIFYWNNGNKYEGDWKNNKREGKGIMLWNEGDKYEGDFINNKFEGKGIYYFNNGNKYEGDFKNNEFDGKGIFSYNNGDKYEGDYKNDKKEGKGIYYYNNGDKYDGYWKNGVKEGKGIFYYNNGDKYEGYFKNDKKEE